MALAVSFSPSFSLSLHCSSPCGHYSSMFLSCFRYFVGFPHCVLCFCCLFVCEWDASIFPRVNVRDPYKRLGVSRDSSEEEIREARNYLSEQYADHERSRESIEAAYDKIIMGSFRERKRSKINLKSNLKKKVAESPPWIRNLANMVEVPSSTVISQRAILFGLLGVWSVMNPAEGGPAFQVAVSLAACIYLLHDRLKSLGRAMVLGLGALATGWLLGSFLVPVLPSQIIPRTWSLELTTALISYIFLWVACTFLK
ncbi:unnamed protein product [Sphagnum jensenii]|uniref:Chaperone DnaJ-domain superfamily protein n=1 Tax=Sphagnum jensenii TaxID=128206 RepID=A0ABP0WF49_9BRYO